MPQPEPRAALLARLLDVIAIVSLLLTVTIIVTGGFREWTPFGRISVTSWLRQLLTAGIALGVRHWIQPHPSIVARLWIGVRTWWTAAETRMVWPVALSTRLGVFVAGFLGIVLFGYRPDVEVPWRVFDNEILNLPARWDTGWYMGVATDGYQWRAHWVDRQQNIAFFPVYPMLMRYGSLLFAREVMWTGVLISWAAFVAALVYLFRLARERFGGDDRAAAGVALLASYPFALYFSTAYTESLFLLAIAAACYHFERNELWRAGLWGLTAGLTRPNGCLLSVVLAFMALRPLWPEGWKSLRPVRPAAGWASLADRIAVAAAPGIGMLIYSTYIYYLTGNPLQWAAQNAAWGRVYRGLDVLLNQHAQLIGNQGLYTYAATRTVDSLHLAAVLFALACVVPVWRRLGLPYAVLIVVNVLPPLMMGGLLSMGRVTSVLFPCFLWLGGALSPAQRPAWIVAFAMLQAICAAMFFTWRPLY